MKCKDCACYKDQWCTMVTDSPDPDIERDCAHFIQAQRWIPVTERLPEKKVGIWFSRLLFQMFYFLPHLKSGSGLTPGSVDWSRSLIA